MKNVYSFVLILITSIATAQIVVIPDANFKNALVNDDVALMEGSQTGYTDADTNNDGEIQLDEALAVIGLNVANRQISSLEGIFRFSNLITLDAKLNLLTEVDLSSNTNLANLDIAHNRLVNIDLSSNSNLERLFTDGNQLDALDVSQNTALRVLKCHGNNLNSLDVTNNPNLVYLNCNTIPLGNLDVTQNPLLTNLICDNTNLINLDLSQNPDLLRLRCSENNLTSLDLSENTALKFLNVRSNQLSQLDLTTNINLEVLDCGYNRLAYLDVSRAANISFIQCTNNELTGLNIANGNNEIIFKLIAFDNPDLRCVLVDDLLYANRQECNYPSINIDWCIDETAYYTENCLLGNDSFTEIDFGIYPNPSTDFIYISSEENIENIKIYDVQGKLVQESTEAVVNLSKFSSGIYFVRAEIDGTFITKKILKE